MRDETSRHRQAHSFLLLDSDRRSELLLFFGLRQLRRIHVHRDARLCAGAPIVNGLRFGHPVADGHEQAICKRGDVRARTFAATRPAAGLLRAVPAAPHSMAAVLRPPAARAIFAAPRAANARRQNRAARNAALAPNPPPRAAKSRTSTWPASAASLADAIAPPFCRRDRRSSRPKNGSRTLSPTKLNMRIQSFGEFPRMTSRMIFRRSSREAAPYLLKPLFVFVNGDHGFN